LIGKQALEPLFAIGLVITMIQMSTIIISITSYVKSATMLLKHCITGKYEEILVNTFHFVKYRVILQQNQYFVCFAILKTSSNCGLTALILIHALVPKNIQSPTVIMTDS
jgi:hypothetical protein